MDRGDGRGGLYNQVTGRVLGGSIGDNVSDVNWQKCIHGGITPCLGGLFPGDLGDAWLEMKED